MFFKYSALVNNNIRYISIISLFPINFFNDSRLKIMVCSSIVSLTGH